MPPHNDYMNSFNESNMTVEFKSGLEERAFAFCDVNEKIEKWSVECFAIQYVKPTDNRIHRYFPDLFIKFKSGHSFLVEVKSSGETKAPVRPKKLTPKSERGYKRALTTWSINQAKWKEAKKFCESKGIKFIFLTEAQLG